jgi:hypothetical protein
MTVITCQVGLAAARADPRSWLHPVLKNKIKKSIKIKRRNKKCLLFPPGQHRLQCHHHNDRHEIQELAFDS